MKLHETDLFTPFMNEFDLPDHFWSDKYDRKTYMSVPLLFVLFYQKYYQNRVCLDLFRVVVEFRFLGSSTETLIDDVMNMMHTFGLS